MGRAGGTGWMRRHRISFREHVAASGIGPCTDGCEILLMDEAFSALDLDPNHAGCSAFLQEKSYKTILFITHDLDEALRIGDNIAILIDRRIIRR